LGVRELGEVPGTHHAEVIALKGESYRLKGRGKEVTASSDST